MVIHVTLPSDACRWQGTHKNWCRTMSRRRAWLLAIAEGGPLRQKDPAASLLGPGTGPHRQLTSESSEYVEVETVGLSEVDMLIALRPVVLDHTPGPVVGQPDNG